MQTEKYEKNDIRNTHSLVRNLCEAGLIASEPNEKKLELKNKLLNIADQVVVEQNEIDDFTDCSEMSIVCESCPQYLNCLDAVNEKYHIVHCTLTGVNV